jgi:phosphinothricin acetyltransferase
MTTIVPCEARHIASINALTNHAITQHWHFGLEPEPLENTRAAWEKGRGAHPWIVAEGDAGEFLGFARASRWSERRAYDWTALSAIYLNESARGRGVGRVLYGALFECLAAQGFVTVIAGITLPNEASVRLHESMGMVRVGVFERVGYKFGRWWPVGYWQRSLRDVGEGQDPGEVKAAPEVVRRVLGGSVR